ncbi:MAG: hypothetical protein EAZ89_15860 [Bacteroidetes bacterium]|nr:MAG: hypothetical protein EAZ89_15860 [Bacteroidota bacterium]
MRFLLLCAITFLFIVFRSPICDAQLVTVSPAKPTADDTVTLIFDAQLGNGALKNYDGTVYLHTGIITGSPDQPSGWRYVQGEWGTDDRRMRMTALGKNRYRIRFHIRSFYGLPQDEPFLQLSFVFRNQNGSIVAKDSGDADIYYPRLEKYEHGPLERADGRDAETPGALTVITLQNESREIYLSDGRHALRISNYETALRVDYSPNGDFGGLLNEGVNASAVPFPLRKIKKAKPGRPVDIPWNGYLLRIEQNPLRLLLIKGNTLVFEQEAAGFFDATDSLTGPVTGLRFRLPEGQQVYGAGSRAVEMNRRGRRLYAYNTATYGYLWGEEDLNLSVPLLLTSGGYGVFFDSYRRGYFDIGKTEGGVCEAGFKDTVLSWYLIPGELPQIVRSYTQLTGRQPLPPRWALGYIQSRYGYKSQQELLSTVNKTLAAGFPLDAVMLDLYWFGDKGRMGDFEWDRRQWPSPDNMMQTLDSQQIHTILISETYFTKGSRFFGQLDSLGYFARGMSGKSYLIPDFWAGPAGLLDLFQAPARDWLWQRYEAQIVRGADGWWCDSGEPENHPSPMIHSTGKAEEVHNLYGSYWARLLYENYGQYHPEQRPFTLVRSGYAGMQRYGALPWSGDVSRNWGAFRAQVPIMLTAGLCGFAYMHSDLGGFTGGPPDEELYRRWLQMGAFSPLMRVHGDATGAAPEPVFASNYTQRVVKEALMLRYRLLPYHYTLAQENSTLGAPLARTMSYVFPQDPEAWRADDGQYMWGDALLVCPVLEKGQVRKPVYLPAGLWYDFYSDEVFAGGRWIEVALVQERIPLFVRAGYSLPMCEGLKNTSQFTGNQADIHIYLASGAQGRLYTDNGAAGDAQPAELQWQLGEKNGRYQLDLSVSGENTPFRNLRFIIHGLPVGVSEVFVGDKGNKGYTVGELGSGVGFEYEVR